MSNNIRAPAGKECLQTTTVCSLKSTSQQAGRSTIDYSSAHNTKAKSPNKYPSKSHVRSDGMPKTCRMSAMSGEEWNGCQKVIGSMLGEG
ncbi:hypothetical protein EYC80_001675 [Monilinia laxa]|uniref:Uncharacterized protein n=1 Tax=Monilinia laxa TaxID=61186 RepID=A0A5N6K5M2_MONLA|nr:hypothetical protein EYC80_001675 [Monilinia laxa]